ncbi:c-type cytochrome [Pseudooceanicola sp.]|uniref:c-type cytochrome n=1 Tax=Pseudooceanicola sp. TaxID=1914328 RepID=UPI004058F51E
MRKLFLATAALATLGVTSAAIGASHAEKNPAVEARQSLMHLYAFHLGPLGAMAKGDMEYDAEMATVAATNLASLAALNQMALWPEGTDNESIEGTRALPAIWEEGSDIGQIVGDLQTATAALAETAGDGVEAVRAGLGPVGGACGACHKAYRASN